MMYGGLHNLKRVRSRPTHQKTPDCSIVVCREMCRDLRPHSLQGQNALDDVAPVILPNMRSAPTPQ